MLYKHLLAILILVVSISFAYADPKKYCCQAEAELLTQKAAEYYIEDKERALSAFQDKNSSFFFNDLYVFAINKRGVIITHGDKPQLIGKSSYNMKDTNGQPFVQNMLKIKDKGWVSYTWPDSRDNGIIKMKHSYIMRIQGDAIGVGFFEKP